MHMSVYIYLTKYNLVSSYDVRMYVCFQECLFGIVQPINLLFPGEQLSSKIFSVAYILLYVVEAWYAFSIHFGMFIGVIFTESLLGQACLNIYLCYELFLVFMCVSVCQNAFTYTTCIQCLQRSEEALRFS